MVQLLCQPRASFLSNTHTTSLVIMQVYRLYIGLWSLHHLHLAQVVRKNRKIYIAPKFLKAEAPWSVRVVRPVWPLLSSPGSCKQSSEPQQSHRALSPSVARQLNDRK